MGKLVLLNTVLLNVWYFQLSIAKWIVLSNFISWKGSLEGYDAGDLRNSMSS